MAYRTVTKLNDFIKKYQIKVSNERDCVITIKDVMEELGQFADISWNTVKQIKNKDMQPSLAVAMRIAEFFETTVEEMFIVEQQDTHKEPQRDTPKTDKPQCSHTNCENDSFARGLCNKHYQQFRNHNPTMFNTETPTVCSEKNCNNSYHAKNLCSFHYYKHYREGRKE